VRGHLYHVSNVHRKRDRGGIGMRRGEGRGGVTADYGGADDGEDFCLDGTAFAELSEIDINFIYDILEKERHLDIQNLPSQLNILAQVSIPSPLQAMTAQRPHELETQYYPTISLANIE